MKLLVTGGAGFIGSHVVDKLLSTGHHVTAFDDFNSYYDPSFKRQNVLSAQKNPNYKLIEGDISDLKTVKDVFVNHSFDRIIHLAARAGVRPSVENPFLYQRVNVEGTLNLLECAREHGVKKITFGSTSSIYGLNEKVPFAEDDPTPNIISPYAATKLAGEALCRSYHQLHGMDIAVLRFFTVYGPRGRPDMMVYNFTEKIFKGQPIPVFGDGSSQRDYTYVDDIVQGVIATIDRQVGFEIFNLGESETNELRKVIGMLEQAVGKKAEIKRMPEQPGDVPKTYADIRKAKKVLGYNPQVKVDKGIPKFVEWFMKERKGK